ncbi:MAG: rhodanese-like domain-containing protein, partial [gamma proteobacterium endosymbiont of Lamellibrachia anaximandri]|nr:rhodanese-like domain-containing protein [gamma proteobacterium endosymbiont of Lamellibrachia anaximandri]
RRARMPTLLPLWRKARRVSSAASRLPGTTSLRFALHGWQRKAMLALALLAVVAFLPRIIGRLRQGPTLGIDELNKRLNKNDELLLLDVRSANDYQGELGHIAGSRNIPLEALESRLTELSPYLEKPIALICTTDRRSKKAARILGNQGFADVHVVTGGMTQWNQEERHVEPHFVQE